MEKILIVDDQPEVRALLALEAANAGFDSLSAASGPEALQLLERHGEEIGLVFLDVRMPAMDGFATARLMRQLLDGRWIPIIFLTANSDLHAMADGISAGGDDYLFKPAHPLVIQAKIKSMMRISEAQVQLQLLVKQLVRLNEKDELTDVFNRKGFFKRVEERMPICHRQGTPIAVILLDVDCFKAYNDCYGHVQGDQCLKAVARLVREQCCRETDLVGRYGGEEFIVWLFDTDLQGGKTVARRIVRALNSRQLPHRASTVAPYVTASLGVVSQRLASHKTQGFDITALIQTADDFLYQAKNCGRNTVVGGVCERDLGDGENNYFQEKYSL